MRHRYQNMIRVNRRAAKYYQRQKQKLKLNDPAGLLKQKKLLVFKNIRSTRVYYDARSQSHSYVRNILRKYSQQKIRPISVSLPSLAAKVCPKRRVISAITKHAQDMVSYASL